MTDITPTSLSGAEFGLDLWRSLADAIPDMLLLVDRRGEILYINHTPPGVKLDQVLGRSALNYVPRESRAELQDSLRQIFATGGTRWREQRVIHPDGTERWYAMHTGPVLLEDEVSAAIIIARDITDSKRGQFALAESEAKYRTLVEYAPEAIVVFDIDACRFVEVNQNACNLSVFSRSPPGNEPDSAQPSDSTRWASIRRGRLGLSERGTCGRSAMLRVAAPHIRRRNYRVRGQARENALDG